MTPRNQKIHRRQEDEEEEEENVEEEEEEEVFLCVYIAMVILPLIAKSMRKVIIIPTL